MRAIISGGGTGGHIFPAVAIANEIKRQIPDAKILFVGALGKMEMEKVPKAGYDIVGLPVAGFNRSALLSNLGLPYKLIKSLWKARKVIKNFKPDIAIGVGGFASGPTLAMANMMGIKTLIQEQNSYAGVTNKILAKKASKVCVAYPDMDKFFDEKKIVFTGNPVRADLQKKSVSAADSRSFFGLEKDRKTLLVIGGSLGARSINMAVAKGLNDLLKHDVQIIWQTGKNYLDQAKSEIYALQTSRVFVSDFIYEMDKAYAAADLVISRSGALSVSELAVLGKAAVLVPYPLAAEDHQTQNALSLSTNNAAILIPDHQTSDDLVNAAIDLFENEPAKRTLETEIVKYAKPNAAKEIVDEVLKAVRK